MLDVARDVGLEFNMNSSIDSRSDLVNERVNLRRKRALRPTSTEGRTGNTRGIHEKYLFVNISVNRKAVKDD